MKKIASLLAFATLSTLATAAAAPLTLNVSLMDGEKPFLYHNPLTLKNGQKLSISEVKFYVSNVALIRADGKEVPVAGLSLANLKKGTPPQNIEIFKGNAPVGDYRGIRFDVGVPRALNHLDATKAKAPLSVEDGMYWAWNSGYIFLSVLGKTDAGGSEKDVALHVGGDNHRITVNLADLQKPSMLLKVTEKGLSVPVQLNLAALVASGLGGEEWDLSKANYQQVHMGPTADQLAKNANSAFGKGK